MSDITLYTYALSPFGMKVYWALVLKKLPFSLVYVSPRTTEEIAFTNQHMVPVLKVDDEWKLDSTPIVHWLDELFPATPLTEQDQHQQQPIEAADNWCTHRLIPACYRHMIDSENPVAMFDTGWKLASTMNKTSGNIPLYAYPIWPFRLRKLGFIQQNVDQVAHFGSLQEMDETLLHELEEHIADGPFIGGRQTPSLADAAIYGQLFATVDLKMKRKVDFRKSKKIHQWMTEVDNAVATIQKPQLYPSMGSGIA